MSFYKEWYTYLSIAVVMHLMYNIFFKSKTIEVRKGFHEVIMFHSALDNLICRHRFDIERKERMITKGMERFLYYLNKPLYNLDICLYEITDPDIINSLFKLHYRGVLIRIITDANSIENTIEISVKKLQYQGVMIKFISNYYEEILMHHNFCLVDTLSNNDNFPQFVMTGSLEWTPELLYGQHENYLVTSETKIVQEYRDEFEKLWSRLTPYKPLKLLISEQLKL